MANASSRVADDSPGPWMDWEETDRAERAIRFIETYCRAPKGYGFGEPLKLSPEQKQWFREILQDHVSIAVKSCPRGEGKSTEFAALALWATFDKSPTGAPQVPIVATTVGQAVRSVYGVALKMVEAEPELADRCIIRSSTGDQKIEVPTTGGTCFPISCDPDGLQGLDPSLAIVDEIGFQSIKTWQSVQLASGKRSISLMVGIGTPGFNRDNALWELRTSFLENGLSDGIVYHEYAAPDGCDYKDESNWYLASSALRNGYRNINAMRAAVASSSEAYFRIFYLGQWVEGTDAWLGQDGKQLWDEMESPYVFDPELPLYVGLDVGIKRDSTALVMVQNRHDRDALHAKAKVWVPEKGKPVNLDIVMQYIRELCSDYNVQIVAYDPRLFEYCGRMLADEGYPMAEFPQSIERMTPATMDLYTFLNDKKLTHDKDDLFRSHILSAIPRHNERGFMLSKINSTGRIDAAIALTIAYAMVSNPEKKQPPLAMF